MKTSFLLAAGVAALLAAPAFAQKTPDAVVVVIDTQRVSNECNACKTAAAALKVQADAIQARATALANPLQAEGQAIQTAGNALNGKAPDAALAARITAFQQKQQAAQVEMQQKQEGFNRNRNYVAQQINTKLEPIFQQVMQAHGANLALDVQATLAASNGVDVSNEVMAALNKALPSLSVNAPAQAATPGR